MPILQIDSILKRFGQATAVDGVSLKCGAGEVVGLLGVNGAGKTTIMNMILGLTIPDGGSIQVFGKDLDEVFIKVARNEIEALRL